MKNQELFNLQYNMWKTLKESGCDFNEFQETYDAIESFYDIATSQLSKRLAQYDLETAMSKLGLNHPDIIQMEIEMRLTDWD